MLGIVASRNGRSRNGRIRNSRSRIGRSRIGTSTFYTPWRIIRLSPELYTDRCKI